jgi:hypothetical protein
MKNFLIQISVCTAIMVGIAYFVLPSYSGKIWPAFKFGLMWGLVTGILLFLAIKAIGALTARG